MGGGDFCPSAHYETTSVIVANQNVCDVAGAPVAMTTQVSRSDLNSRPGGSVRAVEWFKSGWLHTSVLVDTESEWMCEQWTDVSDFWP